jgi:eukaryotic-like serine/threonine-protein kinase
VRGDGYVDGQMPLASGIELPERYRVTRHIASGGMASVWEVEDTLLGRVVAVKVLGAQYAADPAARARFQREARTAARVSEHPHIATIYDTGEHGDDTYIVMEYFSGGTVADRLRAAKDGGEPVPRKITLRWLREAALALDAAHAAGIVHRDVKPANLLIDAQERLAVGDFGIARLADDTHMTQTGQVLGTAAYLSPEQALGQPATAASDRYALAVVAYELLTGTRPFAGGPVTAQARQHVEDQPDKATDAAPGLPAAIDDVFGRGLAKDPRDRPRSAVGFVDEIERALRVPTAPTRRVESTRAMPPVVSAAGAAGAGAAAAAANPSTPSPPQVSTHGGRQRETTPAPTPTPTPAPVASGDAPAPLRRPSSLAAPPPGQGRRRPAPWLPIGVAAAAIAAVIVAVALATGGGDGERSATTTPQQSQSSSSTTKQPAADAEQPADSPPAPPPPPATSAGTGAGAGSATAAQLNDQGYNLWRAGDAEGAVPLLTRSVNAFRDAKDLSNVTYHYALYNLANALIDTGQAAAAIQYLEERLQRSNDRRGVVRKTLEKAQAQVNGATTGDGEKPKAATGAED